MKPLPRKEKREENANRAEHEHHTKTEQESGVQPNQIARNKIVYVTFGIIGFALILISHFSSSSDSREADARASAELHQQESLAAEPVSPVRLEEKRRREIEVSEPETATKVDPNTASAPGRAEAFNTGNRFDSVAVPQHMTQLSPETYDRLNAILPRYLVLISHVSALDPSLTESELIQLGHTDDTVQWLHAISAAAPDMVDAMLMYETDVVGRRLTVTEMNDLLGSDELYQLLDYERTRGPAEEHPNL